MLLFEYPLDNTWTYDTLFSTTVQELSGCTLGLSDVSRSDRELVARFFL
jgi:hypothetical protein